jgi:hypothetical protein
MGTNRQFKTQTRQISTRWVLRQASGGEPFWDVQVGKKERDMGRWTKSSASIGGECGGDRSVTGAAQRTKP